MHRNEALYDYLLDKTWGLTEAWYENLDKSKSSGVYASQDPKVINNVKQQNYAFHKKFCEVFNMDEEVFFKEFEGWILDVARDEEHVNTPIHLILREFFRTQDQYIELINQFQVLHEGEYPKSEVNAWYQIVIKTFGKIMLWFTEEYNDHAQRRLKAQQELILELSSPVISLSKDIALLPLVGDIDTTRAKIILENTLEQCAKLGVNQLFVDLSGVVMIDTMVAHQLFQLFDALNLIGVKTTLSGLRPEIAQTSVQLGLKFEKVTIKSTLSKAIQSTRM